MTEQDWKQLLKRIKERLVTPFLGAGAAAGVLPLGSELAKEWADLEGYPLEDPHDLARVAQYLGVAMDPMEPKERICQLVKRLGRPDYDAPGEPHSALARLPLPIYMTTNYDDFMADALRHHDKDPSIDVCRWNSTGEMRDWVGALNDPVHKPTPANPVVYHLHGHYEIPESVVLTEDDYLAFLVAVAKQGNLLPHQIMKALTGTSLLFIGYRLADWDFRVLHRGLVMGTDPSLRRMSVTVQLDRSDEAKTYLDRYFGAMQVRVYWGTAEAFVTELEERWAEVGDDR